MTIIEAKELAMKGKIVICPTGIEWVASDFTDKDWCHPTLEQVFGVWREKKEPRRVWAVEEFEEGFGAYFENKESAEEHMRVYKGERIVEFVEVVP